MREQLAVEDIESVSIDTEAVEYSFAFDFWLDRFADRRIVPEDLRISICYTWSATRSECDGHDCLVWDARESENREWSLHDPSEIGRLIEVEFHHIAEPITEGIRQTREASGRTDESESRDIHTDTRRSSPRADHDIDSVVLHRWVKDLLDLGTEPVYLIDEEDLSLGETREERDDIRLLLDRRATGWFDRGCHLVCDDRRDSGFPESRRSVKEDMFEGLFADFCWLYSDCEMLFHLSLPDIFW